MIHKMKQGSKTFKTILLFIVFFTLSFPSIGKNKITSTTALQSYIHNTDHSFSWQAIDSIQTSDLQIYRLRLVSQTWHNIPWVHEMEIIVPNNLKYEDALLFISGGSLNKESQEPNFHEWDNNIIKAMSQIANDCHAITAILWQVPRQPLFNGLYEDEIVSYTFHQFLNNHDYTWPLLFPMAKSAIRAMDAIQDFSKRNKICNLPKKFLISGFSKRGWTSWMAAATGDKRIKAIAPAVIDILNMPVNVAYQKFMYGSYSVQIQDYVKLGITEAFQNSYGKELKNMIDPYSYRKKIKIPKLLLLGTNDEYWTIDAVKNYLYGLKGDTFIKYTPNAGHSLGNQTEALSTLETYFWKTIHNSPYTKLNSKAKQKGNTVSLKIKTSETPIELSIWKATSESRDFRKSEFTSTHINNSSQELTTSIELPTKGNMAFFIMAKYKSPINDKPYTLSTRMYFCEPGILYNKPYNPLKDK